MIAWESSALQDNFVLAIDVRTVEGGHQEMEVGRQGLHHGNLGLGCAHDGGDQFGRPGIGVQPGRKRGAIQGLEMSLHTLGCPSVQVLADASPGSFGLEAE